MAVNRGHPVGQALLLALVIPMVLASEPDPDPPVSMARGRALAMDTGKGNCIACHRFRGAGVSSNVGPELRDMARRYPDRQALRAQIWDAGARNPDTLMPPFGRYGILSEDEIDALTDFVRSL